MKKIALFIIIFFFFNLVPIYPITEFKHITDSTIIQKREEITKAKIFSFIEEKNTGAVASFIIGLTSIPLSIILFGLLTGILAIIVGVKALRIIKETSQKGSWLPILGIIFGSIAILISTIIIAYWLLINL